jgi:hypothetical protein
LQLILGGLTGGNGGGRRTALSSARNEGGVRHAFDRKDLGRIWRVIRERQAGCVRPD